MNISQKQIVDIREFLRNYYLLDCRWKGKLSHKRMSEFLSTKGKYAIKINVDTITKESILCGNCIFVKDEVGQIIPYKNITRIMFDVATAGKIDYEEIRLKLLEEQGLTYDDFGNVITIEEKEKKLEQENLKKEILLSQIEEFYEKMAIRNRQLIKKYYKGCVR